jgi:1,4-dihydroxy-2-naphthoate octaprenyltransferase
MLFVYGMASKAYSHPAIRLKKYAITSWFIAGFFQGFFSFLMCYIGINRFELENLFREPILIAALLSSVILWASYPMTQIYQHEEDSKRGDNTLSVLLGIRGTFYFAIIFFTVASAGFAYYFSAFYETRFAVIFIISLAPVVIFFLYWFYKVWNDESKANYTNTMWLNFISSTCLNGFFIWFFLEVSQVLQR